ncbi:SAM-dependent methyltransferase [Psychromonas sp. psych-6C06]|uniref:class I SAM-dependent methyltransferase n=1 Tax=Psychromonas sp. psych-6C06 TaxID=2058089 RepID=UPI000C31D51F|nr:class I SAM-dependent methyltransferase [Psychromonas sp. psych-6C06]PKF61724.1 SAM-dependent methyltransferase [Psychromonas sp. psych-6C06]
MILKQLLKSIKRKFIIIKFKRNHSEKERFECPICQYSGPFMDVRPTTGIRKNAMCPSCKSLERHRLQFLVLETIIKELEPKSIRVLHFAPEPFLEKYLSNKFKSYETADLNMKGVTHNVNLENLPFKSESYDFVFASHVLEHVPDDQKAISEIHRVLSSNGIAILPVPIVSEKTIEYPEPNPYEAYHVRAPGWDYSERYKKQFSKVKDFNSSSFDGKNQLFVCENRSNFPTKECPLRPQMHGEKHLEIVPICYK